MALRRPSTVGAPSFDGGVSATLFILSAILFLYHRVCRDGGFMLCGIAVLSRSPMTAPPTLLAVTGTFLSPPALSLLFAGMIASSLDESDGPTLLVD